MSIFFDNFPENRRHLIGTISGSSIIEEMAEDEFRQMIIECLTGRNPRIYTESWAQAKVFHGVFTAIEEMYLKGKEDEPNFILEAPLKASQYLNKHHTSQAGSSDKLNNIDIILCQWICNLTSKGWDNILQANPANLQEWANSVMDAIDKVGYGSIERNIINMTIYNASLAKKGGLKSAMGNLFEPLLLYSVLSSCGLSYVSADEFERSSGPSFTLNVNEGRQSDAQIKTGLQHPTKIDIDIGFIGKGNPEIIADKTQRFGNMLGGGEKPLAHTIIIVSSIPESESAQLVVRQATLLGAKVITMSGYNWAYLLCEELKQLGILGLLDIPSDALTAQNMLKDSLDSMSNIIKNIPRNLNVPEHWSE